MDSKKWYQSKTIWGSLVAVFAVVAGYLGFDVGAEDQQIIVDAVFAIVGGAGGLLAVYGRVKAEKNISK